MKLPLPLSTPVALIIFNRPDTTARVFAEIAKARPSKLLIIADGPRSDRAGEYEKCEKTRAVVEQVDWDCEISRNYSDINLGCQIRPASGLDWVFEMVEEAIVLEDDCLPDPTFFVFCEELLARYRHDERVMMIGGTNLFGEWESADGSYYFSQWGGTWGWATWRRAWAHFDRKLSLWPTARESRVLECILPQVETRKHWEAIFQQVYDGVITSAWDYQWLLACWMQNGYRIVPGTNLISNIGFTPDGTHCFSETNPLANIPIQALTFPLRHPLFMRPDIELENAFLEKFYGATAMSKVNPPLTRVHRVRAKMSRMMRALLPPTGAYRRKVSS